MPMKFTPRMDIPGASFEELIADVGGKTHPPPEKPHINGHNHQESAGNASTDKPKVNANGKKGPNLPPILSLAEFMATYQTPDYIVDGILQRGRLYALTSPTGHGKTAVTQCIGIHVASGRNIGNIEVAQGTVIFLAGENPEDLCVRMYAACQVYGLDHTKIPLHVMSGNFPLTPEAAEELKSQIDEKGLNPVLIIFDTAASFFPGDYTGRMLTDACRIRPRLSR